MERESSSDEEDVGDDDGVVIEKHNDDASTKEGNSNTFIHDFKPDNGLGIGDRNMGCMEQVLLPRSNHWNSQTIASLAPD